MNRRHISTIPHPLWAIALFVASAGSVYLAPSCFALEPGQQTQLGAPGTVSRPVGAVKAIEGTVITLTPDSGADVKIMVQPTTRILRTAPGAKDLKSAPPIQLQDLQIGDRILVGGKIADDSSSVIASTVVVMKKSDLETKHQQDLQDWQKRGVGGLVSGVNPAAGTVTISVGKKNIVIHATTTTVIRRYPPNSWQFDDAKASTLQQIRPDDQVSARGDRNADGTELTAEEIISGEFRNVAGTINSVDASSSTLNVQDLLSKKTVVVKIAPDSLLRKVPPEIAQRIAMRWKTAAGGAAAAPGSTPASPATPAGATTEGGTGPRGNGMGGHPGGGAPDFQQMIIRMPAVSLAELHKGDAVMIVATAGTSSEAGTAVELIGGVEPIFRAAPSASAAQSMMLGSWSLGGAPSGDAGGP